MGNVNKAQCFLILGGQRPDGMNKRFLDRMRICLESGYIRKSRGRVGLKQYSQASGEWVPSFDHFPGYSVDRTYVGASLGNRARTFLMRAGFDDFAEANAGFPRRAIYRRPT